METLVFAALALLIVTVLGGNLHKPPASSIFSGRGDPFLGI